MNKDNDHIDQLTPAIMQQYLDGRLSVDMQHKVERYLLDHPFEAEAMEGLESLSITDLDSDIQQMKKRLFSDEKETKVIPIWRQYWKVAAVVTVLIVSAFLLLNLGQEEINSSDSELALNEEHSTSKEAPESDDKEEIEQLIVADEVSGAEKAPDVITPQNTEGEEKPNDVVTERLIAKMDDPTESAIAENFGPVSEFARSEETSKVSAVKAKKVEALAMFESDDLIEVTLNEAVVESIDFNVADAISGKVAGISISDDVKDDKADIAKEKIIKGRITSAEDGSSLPGVNVILKGTTQGTISNVDGNYEIKIPDEQSSIAISFIGYNNEEIEVGDRSIVDISMSAAISQLSEVVATGIGKAKRSKSKNITSRKQEAEPFIAFDAYTKYLQDSLRFPQQAIDNQISGEVTLEITVGESGEILKLEVIKGLGYGCDEEAIRLIKEGAAWQNAIKRGSPVKAQVEINVTFER